MLPPEKPLINTLLPHPALRVILLVANRVGKVWDDIFWRLSGMGKEATAERIMKVLFYAIAGASSLGGTWWLIHLSETAVGVMKYFLLTSGFLVFVLAVIALVGAGWMMVKLMGDDPSSGSGGVARTSEAMSVNGKTTFSSRSATPGDASGGNGRTPG